MIDSIARREVRARRNARRVNILPGSHLTVADVEHIRSLVEAFGLDPVMFPDISGALDGTVPDRWVPTTYGGTAIEDIRSLGDARLTIAIGEHMRPPAARIQELTGVEYVVFRQLHGLKAVDRFVSLLTELSGRTAPASVQRRRAQLQDALLDGHFHFSGRKVDRVKRSEAGMVLNPIKIGPDRPVAEALELMGRFHISGIPVVDPDDHLARDRDEPRPPLPRGSPRRSRRVRMVMTSTGARHRAGSARISPECCRILQAAKVEKLPIMTPQPVAWAHHREGHHEAGGLPPSLQGRRRTTAGRRRGRRRQRGSGPGQAADRRRVDANCVDTAHGHARHVIEAVAELRQIWPDG